MFTNLLTNSNDAWLEFECHSQKKRKTTVYLSSKFIPVRCLQLTNTKDAENKTTLLHYLVDIIETKFPDLIAFGEELLHVDRASRVSMDTIQKTLKQMDSSIKNLETDLKNASKLAVTEDDKFLEVMGVSAVSFLFLIRVWCYKWVFVLQILLCKRNYSLQALKVLSKCSCI